MGKERSSYLQSWRQQRYERGLCYRCSNQLDGPQKLCADCRAKSGQRLKQWYANKKALNICPGCQRPHDDKSHLYCKDCRKKRREPANERYRLRKQAGICNRCCIASVGPQSSVYCEACYAFVIADKRERHDRRAFNGNRASTIQRDGGICQVCGGAIRLEVHHRNGDRGNSELDNLITLCHSCHVTLTRLIASPNPMLLLNLVKGQRQV